MKEKIGSAIMFIVLVLWCAGVPEMNTSGTQEQEKTIPEVITLGEVSEKTPEVKKKKNPGYLLVRTTYYNPVEDQCDSDPLVTADGSKISKTLLKKGDLKWIAISQDLLCEYPLGTKVRITSRKYPKISGVYVIHDVMNPRFRYSIDVLSHEDHGHIFGTHLCELRKA
jgi:3D (Asp-Asp-Asp) domain-containing protein